MIIKSQRLLCNPIALCIICLVFATSCLPATQPPAATATVTSTSSPTLTVSPTQVPVITIENIDGSYPGDPFQYNPDFTGFQTGVYIIGQLSSPYSPSLYYQFLESGPYGNFVDSTLIPDSIFPCKTNEFDCGLVIPNTIYDESLSEGIVDSEYMVAVARLVPTENDKERIDEMLIRSVQLHTTSGQQHIWKALFDSTNGTLCKGLSLSPTHEWIAGNCWEEGENYLYFLNLQNETTKFLRPSSPCLSIEFGTKKWWFFNWSPDGQHLSVSCETSNRVYTSCLVSPDTDEFTCRPDGYYRPEAWSPDGSKVAVIDHHSDHNDDLLVTAASCLGNSFLCPEYYRSSLEPVWDNPGPYSLSVVWDPTSENVVWSIYANYLDHDGPTKIWVANLESGEKYQIDWAAGTEIYSISPDGKWLLIRRPTQAFEHWKLLSVNGQPLRDINEALYRFIGWLVVP